jgi:SAM-dependent methyltransferase
MEDSVKNCLEMEIFMETYSDFAQVYDMYMDNVPYEEWAEYIVSLLEEYGIKDGLILDLGCGTGSLTELLANRGYDMIGIDNSEEMLNVALEKRVESGNDILYLNQDMREFELYGTVRAVVSICDSINYIIDEEELLGVFKLVNNYLDKGGYFIFDLNTVYKYKEIGDSVIAENRPEGSFIWENTFYEDEHINEYDLTLYIKDESGKYDRFTERHLQRAYTLEEITRLIEKSGLELVASYDAFTRELINEESERIYIIAREKQKK